MGDRVRIDPRIAFAGKKFVFDRPVLSGRLMKMCLKSTSRIMEHCQLAVSVLGSNNPDNVKMLLAGASLSNILVDLNIADKAIKFHKYDHLSVFLTKSGYEMTRDFMERTAKIYLDAPLFPQAIKSRYEKIVIIPDNKVTLSFIPNRVIFHHSIVEDKRLGMSARAYILDLTHLMSEMETSINRVHKMIKNNDKALNNDPEVAYEIFPVIWFQSDLIAACLANGIVQVK
jgi:hypothetical protein